MKVEIVGTAEPMRNQITKSVAKDFRARVFTKMGISVTIAGTV
jgi:hypothetical protein